MFFLLRNSQVFVFGIISLFAASLAFSNPLPATQTIAITQIVGHESLDKVREGIFDELTKNGYQEGPQTHLIFENAQGNMVVAAQIAQQFAAMQPQVIVAIATPSAQAAANAIKHTNIPLVFASISDPLQAKLVTDLKHPGMNITGTRNVSPIDKQVALIKKILPQAKTIGVVINDGEVNAVDLLKTVVAEAALQNIQVKTASVTTSGDVQTATNSLVGKVDAILLLQDNTIASALPALMKVTNKNRIPVFTTYLSAIKEGALSGLAFDEYAIGQQTGKIVIAILKGEKPGNIAVQDPLHIELALNMDAAREFGIHFSPDLMKQAQLIYSVKVK